VKRACNNISASKPRFVIAMVFITGFFFCVNTSQAQVPYWLITVKHTKYKIGLQNTPDTICLTPKQLKQSVSVKYITGQNEQESATKRIIIVMTTTRQELGRYAITNGKAFIPLDALSGNVTDRMVALNEVQAPSSLLAKRARVGTKLLCYIKW
jgi:hypothetical protein